MKKHAITWLVVAMILLNIMTFLGAWLVIDYNTKQVHSSLSNQAAQLKQNLQTTQEQLEAQLQSQAQQQQQSLEQQTQQTKHQISTVEHKLNLTIRDIQSSQLQLQTVQNQVITLEDKNVKLEQTLDNIAIQSNDFTAIIDDIIETVVSIQTDKGQGSGAFFHESGLIITNKHVIEHANIIQAVDSNNVVYNAQLIGTATIADLAVLKIQGNNKFPFLRFEENVAVGNRVIAVGNPAGLSFTVTEGIVSAKNRIIDQTGIGYIQTDVPINPGNSGGPLVNTNKRIVGINTFKFDENEGLGFAIPADVAQTITEQAIDLIENAP